MDIVKPNAVWHVKSTVKKAIYGLREAPRFRQKERDQKLRELEFLCLDKLAHLVQSHIHPSLWFIVEGAAAEIQLDSTLRSLDLFEVMSGQLNCTNIES